jgi:Arc/MetJ-type ribon-helix-helix transcriptional regulator
MDENKTFNISMPKALLDAIDKHAETEYRNRSDLIREAVRTYIASKGGMDTSDKLSHSEESRIKDGLNFSTFKSEPTIVLSCVYRPQPNSVNNIFTAGSKVMELVENPPRFRNMGWDLRTLDRAKPVAGDYLEVVNGKRKLLRLYRDGQHTFSAGVSFFGHGVERNSEDAFGFNLLAVAELIANFTVFAQSLSENLQNGGDTLIFTIAVSNPKLEKTQGLGLHAYSRLGLEKIGELNLDWAERNIIIRSKDLMSSERIAYLIYSEFCYFFGVRSDELWYINKNTQEIDKTEFTKET